MSQTLRVLSLAIASAVLVACTAAPVAQSTPVPTPTVATNAPTVAPTATPDPKIADGKLMTDLFYGRSVAWYQGIDAGVDALIGSIYPPMVAAPDYGLTHATCLRVGFGTTRPTGYQHSSVPDLSTLQESTGFTLPQGSLVGVPVAGRIYSVTVHESIQDDNHAAQNSSSILHVTVLDGRAYAFNSCI